MSRIHDALLKAQREQGSQNPMLDVESLDIGTSESPLSNDIPVMAADKTEGSPVTDEPRNFRQSSWRPDPALVFMRPDLAPFVEEFRTLRSRLLRGRARRQMNCVLITSANPEEGKTFVTANLALAMSRHPGSRVLVIDGDLRKSNLHNLFGMEPVPGLSDYLSGSSEGDAIVQQTPEPQLCVVTAGLQRDASAELLHSLRMQQFVEGMQLCFDWIFIDSPPVTTVADTGILSELCDGVLLVIGPGTSVDAAQKARKEIGQKMLGVVLNRSQDDVRRYAYDYSHAREKSSDNVGVGGRGQVRNNTDRRRGIRRIL